MKIKQVKHYKIYDEKIDDWNGRILDKWVYDDFVNDPTVKKGWISLTSLAVHEPSDTILVGIGSFSAELLWKFDTKSKTFTSCEYEKVGEKHDAKFHRSMEIDGDTMYGGIALFHDIDKQFEAKGGRIVKYDINSGEFEFLDRPYPPAYIQSIAYDKKRKIIYSFCAMPEVFCRYDIDTKESRLIAHLGNGCEIAQSHNPVIDNDGNVFGTYGVLRAFSYRTGPDSVRIMKYSPDTDKVDFLSYGYPRTDKAGDKGKPDTQILGPDGNIYVGTDYGMLARLNPKTLEVKALCNPDPNEKRLSALAFSPKDGLLYGLTGEHYKTKLFAYDINKDELVFTQEVYDTNSPSVKPDRFHHMVITKDGTIYAGENDNNDRSSYLWEIVVEN